MTTFLLLRHAHSEANLKGILAGRISGIDLSETGRLQSSQLVEALGSYRIDRIICSPLQRCKDTIARTAGVRKKRIFTNAAFIEMDYGSWSGRSLKDLAKEKDWRKIQKSPSAFTFPNGESFSSAAMRVERELGKLARRYPNGSILIVTHGDVIKMALQISNGSPLDNFQKFVVDTCSLSEIEWNKGSRLVVRSNVRITKVKNQKRRSVLTKNRKVLGGGSGV
ncbi:MAG: histidine phosphatase family protein [Rhodoluna sp.]